MRGVSTEAGTRVAILAVELSLFLPLLTDDARALIAVGFASFSAGIEDDVVTNGSCCRSAGEDEIVVLIGKASELTPLKNTV
jgi:hypothetical protein